VDESLMAAIFFCALLELVFATVAKIGRHVEPFGTATRSFSGWYDWKGGSDSSLVANSFANVSLYFLRSESVSNLFLLNVK
jgi:hypothetical protein